MHGFTDKIIKMLDERGEIFVDVRNEIIELKKIGDKEWNDGETVVAHWTLVAHNILSGGFRTLSYNNVFFVILDIYKTEKDSAMVGALAALADFKFVIDRNAL